jgi:hypothetical protein
VLRDTIEIELPRVTSPAQLFTALVPDSSGATGRAIPLPEMTGMRIRPEGFQSGSDVIADAGDLS